MKNHNKNNVAKQHSNHNYLNTQKSNAHTKINGQLVQLWFGAIASSLPLVSSAFLKAVISKPIQSIVLSALVVSGASSVYAAEILPQYTSQTVMIYENAYFNVKLDEAPASNVVVNVSNPNPWEVDVFPATLTFTPSNWQNPQPVNLFATMGGGGGMDIFATINLTVDDALSDDNFDGKTATINIHFCDDMGMMDMMGTCFVGSSGGYSVSDAAATVIENYASDNTNTLPNLQHYVNAGVTGVTATNIAAINAAIDDKEGVDANSTSKIQNIVNSVINALNVIEDYANDSNNPAPTVSDFVLAGVTGVSVNNIAEVNTAIDALQGSDVDTTAKIQVVVDASAQIILSYNLVDLANLKKTQEYALTPGSSPLGFTFNNDGTRLYITTNSSTDITQYDLSTAYDVSTATAAGTGTVRSQLETGVSFLGMGMNLLTTSYSSSSAQVHILNTPYDITSVNANGTQGTFNLANEDSNPYTLINAGPNFYMLGNTNKAVYEYTPDPSNPGLLIPTGVVMDISSEVGSPRAMSFSKDGSSLYVLSGVGGAAVYEYELSAPHDISSFTYKQSVAIASTTSNPYGLEFSNDGKKMFAVDSSAAKVFGFTLEGHTYSESSANDGAIDNSDPIVINLEGDTFAGANGSDLVADGNVTIGNVPAGLTAVVTKDSDTQVTLTFTGNATSHQDATADDVANVTFVFANAAFASNDASKVENSGDTTAYSGNVQIDFVENLGPDAPSQPSVAGAPLVNTATPAITGSCTAGEIITVYVDGTAISPTETCGSGGSYSITPSTDLGEGSHSITVTAKDGTGESPASPAVSITVDTQAPTAPTAPTVAGAPNTNTATPEITGSCTAGETVTVYVDGTPITPTATCDTSGNFSITPSTDLGEGDHDITVTVKDTAGNESPASSVTSITVDTHKHHQLHQH